MELIFKVLGEVVLGDESQVLEEVESNIHLEIRTRIVALLRVRGMVPKRNEAAAARLPSTLLDPFLGGDRDLLAEVQDPGADGSGITLLAKGLVADVKK